MSLLVVGLSHRTSPVSLLEKVSISGDELIKSIEELAGAESISEVLVLSTCNRIEVYADVARFHPAVAEITSVLARHSGLEVSDLSECLYVHFAEAATEHWPQAVESARNALALANRPGVPAGTAEICRAQLASYEQGRLP